MHAITGLSDFQRAALGMLRALATEGGLSYSEEAHQSHTEPEAGLPTDVVVEGTVGDLFYCVRDDLVEWSHDGTTWEETDELQVLQRTLRSEVGDE